jgi:hypothetical protein
MPHPLSHEREMNRVSVAAIAFAMLVPISEAHPQAAADTRSQIPLAVLQAFEEGMRTEIALLATSISDSTKRESFAREIARTTAKLEPTLDTARWNAPGLRIWVAFPTFIDHFHRYTIAQFGGSQFRLGGFTTPELVPLDRVLPPNKENPIRRAMLLAALADRNGGERLSIRDSASVRLSTGETMVWVITESYQSHDFRPIWTKTFYSFLFGVDGALRQWARFEQARGG